MIHSVRFTGIRVDRPTRMRDLDLSCCFGTLLQVPHLDIVFDSKLIIVFWRPQEASNLKGLQEF